jgi:hypothetical protein
MVPAPPGARAGSRRPCPRQGRGRMSISPRPRPEKRAAYNLARRVKHEPRRCTKCGELFVSWPVGHADLLGSVPLAPVAPPGERGVTACKRPLPTYSTSPSGNGIVVPPGSRSESQRAHYTPFGLAGCSAPAAGV